ncbi:MAG: SIS domain-containing protein [Pseudomonadota bacterium]
MTQLTHRALAEIGAVLDAIPQTQMDDMVQIIRSAHRIALHGVGREGLMMKSLAMRLYHVGLDAHVVGDMTTPPLTTDDLLLVSAGPGQFRTVGALVEVAKTAGAMTLCVTAEPSGLVPISCDHVVHLPAQTMASDQNDGASVLPMGSLFEATQFLFFELVVLRLRDALGLSPEDMRANHTNLE